jgi:putative hydrolase of the HAD superfamily
MAVIILDMGGVLMRHNMPLCLQRMENIIGKQNMEKVLGLSNNGEGIENSLMEQYEVGQISTNDFIEQILGMAQSDKTRKDVIDAWNAMHDHIPPYRIDILHEWKRKGHHLFMLSNNNELHWEHIKENYALDHVFEDAFASHLLHVSKPNPTIYQIVDQRIRALYPNEVPFIFVDDIAINREVGESFGWKTYADIETLQQELS